MTNKPPTPYKNLKTRKADIINMEMNQAYLDQMRAHVDAGGKLTHRNAVELLTELERLRERIKVLEGDALSYGIERDLGT